MVYQLTDRDISFLTSNINFTTKSYEKGESIKTRNKYSDKLCLLKEGLIYLCAENDNFERSILRIIKKGDIFSRSMLLPDNHGVSYLIAKKTSSVYYFYEKDVLSFLSTDNDNNEYKEKITALLKAQLYQQPLIHDYILQQKTIKSKLMAYIKFECEAQQSDTIKVPIPYSDLAEFLGIDRSAMMKELSKMKEENLIIGQKKTIKIN